MNNENEKRIATSRTQGDSYSLESRTSDGKAISVIVRLSYEFADFVDDSTREAAEKCFQKCWDEIEELF